MGRLAGVVAATVAGFALCAPGAHGAVFMVSSGADSGPGTLRAAAAQANANEGADIVLIEVGVQPTLTSQVEFTGEATLFGQGARLTTIRQTGADRVLEGNILTVREVTVTGGRLVGSAAIGGGILAGRLTLDGVILRGNSVAGGLARGGGAYASDLDVADSTITRNLATSVTTATGGGLYADDDLAISTSTIFDNTAEIDVGIGTPNPNSIARGGGLATDTAQASFVSDSAIVGNHVAGPSTQGANFAEGGSDTTAVRRTVIAGGTTDGVSTTDVCSGGFDTVSSSLVFPADVECAPSSGPGSVDPQLGPLADNGGPTDTLLPAAGSPLVDAIAFAACAGGTEDQRGLPRPQFSGAPCDIGPVEVQRSNTPPTASVSLAPSSPQTNDTLTATIGVSDPDTFQTLRYDVRWTVNGTVRKETLDTTGATSTFDLSLAGNGSKGQQIAVRVIPRDGLTTGPAVTRTVTIANSNPTVTSLAISPGTLRTATVATAQIATQDADGDAVQVTPVWRVDGVARGFESTFDLGAAGNGNRGQTVRLEAVISDGTASIVGGQVSKVVANTAPVLATLVPTPGVVRTADVLTLAPVTVDADGDPVTVTTAWLVDGQERQRSTAGTFDLGLPGQGDRGQTIVGGVVAISDGRETVSTGQGSSWTVAGSVPRIDAVALTPQAPRTAQTVTAVATGATDADGDPVGVRWRWTVDGVERRTAETAGFTDTFDLAVDGNGDVGQVVMVEAVPLDVDGDGAAKQAQVTVAAEPPAEPTPTPTATPAPTPTPTPAPPATPTSDTPPTTGAAGGTAPVPTTTPTPVPPPATGQSGPAPLPCSSRRVLDLRLLRGSTRAPGLRIGRASLRGARILSATLSPRRRGRSPVRRVGTQRLRLDLRSLPVGVHTLRVRVRVRNSPGTARVLTITRRYRTCTPAKR